MIGRHSIGYISRARPHTVPPVAPVCAGFGYRNMPALYPHLGAFHLSAATCSRYSIRTFQLVRSCAFGPHKRHEFRVRIWSFWVRQTMERQARLLFALAPSVCPVTGRKIKRLALSQNWSSANRISQPDGVGDSAKARLVVGTAHRLNFAVSHSYVNSQTRTWNSLQCVLLGECTQCRLRTTRQYSLIL